MTFSRSTVFLLLMPALLAFAVFFVSPLATIAVESLREYVPGRVGGATNAPLTLANYGELLDPGYLRYFFATFRLSFIASFLALLIGYPIAYLVARERSRRRRRLWISFLVGMMFLSVLVRVYSIELTFGPVGLFRHVVRWLDINPNGVNMTEAMVVAGLLHYLIPIVALTLIATVQNINPRFSEVAQSLGASRAQAMLTVVVPLSMRGVMSAFVLCYSLSLSAFVIPMVLGKGYVLFVTNLIYSRFSEVSDWPGGAALSITMLALSLLVVYGLMRLTQRRFDHA